MARRPKRSKGGSGDRQGQHDPQRQPRRPTRAKPAASEPPGEPRQASELRIIGGTMRGRRLHYSGRFETRPMKERVREAAFNLLGPSVAGMHAIDLFAGTGALGLEAVSRGALSATLIERHVPSAKLIRDNIVELGVQEIVEVRSADTFVWARRDLDQVRIDVGWVVFCSPPFSFYQQRREQMLALVERLADRAPPGSVLVVEADETFDFAQLPRADEWTVRAYPPAVIGILRLEERNEERSNHESHA